MSDSEPSVEETGERIESPFAQITSTVQGARGRSSVALWVVGGVLALILMGVAGYFASNYLNNPYRTLEAFPMDKYLSDYRAMTGAKFKAQMKVSADLGSKSGTGRLLIFTVDPDNRSLVVLMPSKLSGVYFAKGQNYLVSLEVGEGELVYADSYEKE